MSAPRRYVAGFVFDTSGRYVLLIRKNRPEWQAGKLNGVGGKVESCETDAAAMRREGVEETGLANLDWKPRVFMHGNPSPINPDGWTVTFYIARTDLAQMWSAQAHPPTDERLFIWPVCWLPDNVLPNVRWLVPLCLDENIEPTDFFDRVGP